MSEDAFLRFMMYLMTLMQVSIVVPMAVVWLRRKHFSPAVKTLSGYVYLSAAASLGARLLYPAYFATNYGFLIGFNIGKIALLAAVYRQVLPRGRTQRLVVGSAVAILGIGMLSSYDANLALAVSRVAQCALLAGFALAYVTQTLDSPTPKQVSRDPLWLLSVGQLIYSAGTVTAFSLDYLTVTAQEETGKYVLIALAGLVFNGFLTLAFLRDHAASSAPAKAAKPAHQFAG